MRARRPVARLWLAAVGALAAGVAAGGCKRSAAPRAGVPDAAPPREVVFLDKIAVDVSLWPPSAGPPPEARTIAGRVWESLSQSSDFESAGPPAGELRDAGARSGVALRHARLKVEIAVERAPAEGGRPAPLRGGASLSLTWAGSEDEDERAAPWAAAACDGQLPPDDTGMPAAAMALVECALGQAARGLADKQAIRRGDEAAVMMALESADPSLRQEALGVIADRKMTSAVPRLLEMLKSSDELVRDGAIGALVALREPRAVKPITELAAFNDLDMMRRIIDAVGAIGGDEARSYLELVSTGHPLPAVRELAADALGRLIRRAIDAGH